MCRTSPPPNDNLILNVKVNDKMAFSPCAAPSAAPLPMLVVAAVATSLGVAGELMAQHFAASPDLAAALVLEKSISQSVTAMRNRGNERDKATLTRLERDLTIITNQVKG